MKISCPKNSKVGNSRHPAPKYRGISGSDDQKDEIPKQVRDDLFQAFLTALLFQKGI